MKYAEQWRRARWSVLEAECSTPSRTGRESDLLTSVPLHRQQDTLLAVSAASEAVGRMAKEELGRPFSVDEASVFLGAAGIPCFAGVWCAENHVSSRYHYRGACVDLPLGFCCDYWREAAGGVARGLNPEIQFARHRSIGHGDEACFDYVYRWPLVDRRRGPVPSLLKHCVRKSLAEMQVAPSSLSLEGYSERTLYYRLEENAFPRDSERRTSFLEGFGDRLRRTLPDLRLRDAGETR